VQDALENLMPGRTVEIEEWDTPTKRFLVRVRGSVDSGAFYIFDQTKPRLTLFAARAPWLDRVKTHQTTRFSFSSTTGHTISGTLTFPRAARAVPVPVIVLCGAEPWARVHMDFQPELMAFAEIGFAVIQVNTAGAWGFGIKHREAMNSGYEEAQINDIAAAVDYIAKGFAINPHRVALVGNNYGGYLALRGLELAPKKFKCAVAIDSILDLENWMKESRWTNGDSGPQIVSAYLGGKEHLKDSPLLSHSGAITGSLLLLNYRGVKGQLETSAYIDARKLARDVNSREVVAEVFDLTDDYMANLPRAKAEAYRKIEDFLNVNIYDYKVNLGDLKTLKD
jgi:pimeloyl-ACP methyl ester carboxylesterase